MYRMDYAYKRHRNWLPPGQALAFKTAGLMNWRHLMWANDFPHSDSTWPWSQDLLAEHAGDLTAEQRRAILCGNVAALYAIDLAALDGVGSAVS